EDVYLPGRNVILLGKAGVYCASAQIGRLALGTLGHNPFPDATPDFRHAMARALSLGLAHPLEIDAPYAEASKAEVIRRGAALGVPFELTLSCMNPRSQSPITQPQSRRFPLPNPESRIPNPQPPLHCGRCSKCRERHDAFVDAGIPDPTTYETTTNLGQRKGGKSSRRLVDRSRTLAKTGRRPFDSRCGAAYRARVIRAGDTFDAVVIGGGPAGSAAAHLLASWHWSVLLVHHQTSRPSLAESLPPSIRQLFA